MKKLFFAFMFVFSVLWFSYAWNIPVEQVSSNAFQCNSEETSNIYYYIEGDSLMRHPTDSFGNTVNSIISKYNNESSIQIWNNWGIGACNDWSRVSNFIPENSTDKVVFKAYGWCEFTPLTQTKENDPNRIDGIIHFTIGYYLNYPWAPSSVTSPWYYREYGASAWTCYPGGQSVGFSQDPSVVCPSSNLQYGPVKQHVWECLIYRNFRCGDGIVNRPNGSTSYANGNFSEQCDDWNTNNNDACSNTCQINEPNPSSCTVNIQETNAYVHEDGSFEPHPIHVAYTVDGAQGTTIQTNIPWAQNNHNATVTILNNLQNNYYIHILDANGAQIAQCSDTIDLGSCGDDTLQPEYEECEINTQTMPDSGIIPSDLDGCNATCQLEEPTCRVVVDPNPVTAGERAYFSGQTQSWATFLTLDYDEWGPTYDFATSFPGGLPVAYFHFDSGVYYDEYNNPELGYNYVATVENARGMWNSRQLINANATRPNNICGGDTSATETLVDVEKSLLQEWVVFASWDIVGFKIVVSNNSDNRVHGLSVTDYFSPLLDWDGNIEVVWLWNTTVVTSGIVSSGLNLQWITASNIDLAPMSTGAIYLSGVMYSDLCNWPNTGVMTGDVMDDPIWFGASFPCGPVTDIQKFQSTGTSLDSFTQESIPVEIGDSLNYRIEFSNDGGSIANDVLVSDYLPAGITYVGSEIFIYTGWTAIVPTPLFTEQWTLGDQEYIVYSGFDLASEQSGYIMIYGEVSDNTNYALYENTADLSFANPYQTGISNTVIAVRWDVPLVDFQKNIIDSSGHVLTSWDSIPYFFSGDEIIFELSIENNGDAISGIVVDDVRPDLDQNCIMYSGWTTPDTSVPVGRTHTSWTWKWTYAPTLPEFGETTFLLYGEVTGGQECAWSYVNTWLLQYYQDGVVYTGEDEAAFEIRNANMLLTKTVDSTDVSVWSEVTFSLYFENDGSQPISNFVLRDLRPATLALQPSLTYPKPYTYIGPGNPSFSPPQPIDGGRELQWNRGNQEFLPGMTGMIVLTGIVLDASEAIDLYEATH